MKSEKSKTNSAFPIHVFLFGIYPVIALYLFNISEVLFASILKAVITSFLVLFCIFTFSLMLVRSWKKSAVLTSLTSLLFFFYGHVFDILSIFVFESGFIFRHRYLVPVWILMYIAILVWSLKLRDVSKIIQVLNSISLILVGLVVVQILFYSIGSQLSTPSNDPDNIHQPTEILANVADRDVYYILLDAYGRQDLLEQDYNLNTSDFILQLTDLGFYFPNCAQSNYSKTAASMVSSLNMQYLDSLGLKYEDSLKKFENLIGDSVVRAHFESMGYATITFKSLYPWLDIADTTYHFDYFADESGITDLASLNFQYLFLRTTVLRPVLQWLETRSEIFIPSAWADWLPVNNTLQSREYKQYQQNVFALDSLETTIPNLPGKKFVYAHLFVTHQPFVFFPDGRFHQFLPQSESAYRDQIIFVNSRLVGIIKNILASSEQEPIIILQGDHSYSKREKTVRILNAYYFPDGGDENLYDTITPVNTFRALFNTYYDSSYELLPDISQYADDQGNLYKAPLHCVNTSQP